MSVEVLSRRDADRSAPERRGAGAAGPRLDPAFERSLTIALPRLVRYATRRLGDAAEAEDVAQEALLRAVRSRPALTCEDDVLAWTTVVTRNLVTDRLRARCRSVVVAEVPEPAPSARDGSAADTADVAVARAEARTALDALESLPGRQASVLWAREVEGLPYTEIADRLGMSETAVRSVLHRARRALRREYAARGGSLPVSLGGGLAGLGLLRAAGRAVRRPGAGKPRLFAGALAAATTVGAFGSWLILPTAAPAVTVPASLTPAVVRPVDQPAPRPAAPGVAPVRPAAVGQPSHAAPTPATRPGAPASVPLLPLPAHAACRNVGGSPTGVDCAPPTGATLLLGPTLPVPLPGGNNRIGLGGDLVPCRVLPTTPVASCAAPLPGRTS